MDLTFRVPVQYCSLHQILLSSLDTSITEHRFCFGPAASFFLGLLVILRSSPIACCTPSDLGNSSFAVISFCPFMQFMRFSQQVYWGVCLCSSSGSRLSEISTGTRLSWVALHGMAHGFTELSKPLCYNKAVICEEAIHCVYNSLNLPTPSSHSTLPQCAMTSLFAMSNLVHR